MNLQKKFLNQSFIYFLVTVFTALGGFVSFPIWTRILKPEEYGFYNLFIVSIGLMTTFSKAGLQKSVIRFFSEFAAGKRSQPISIYYSTHIVGSFAAGFIFSLLFLLYNLLFDTKFSIGANTHTLLLLLMVIVIAQSLNSVLISFLRVEQKVKGFAALSFINRYGIIGSCILFAVVFKMGLLGLLLGQAIMESSVSIFFVTMMFWQKKFVVKHFSLKFFREALSFGIPLMPAESSRWMLSYLDRFIIQIFMGAAAVGYYSAGYNMTLYLSILLAAPFNLAIIPMYLDIWENQGAEKTRAFLATVFDYYLMVAIPLICAFCLMGRALIELLASAKYADAYVILPYIVVPLILNSAYSVYGAGLLIYKKTKLVMYYTLMAGVVNLVLNLILIPRMGLVGAAVATLIAYTLLITLTAVSAAKYLKISFRYKNMLGYLAASLIMMWLIDNIGWDTLLGIAMKVGIGLCLYSVCLVFIDGRLRNKLFLSLKFLNH
ncbi:MAG: oligosaccharide flippase family protein [bacterium]